MSNVGMTQNYRKYLNSTWLFDGTLFCMVFFTNTVNLKTLGKGVDFSHSSPRSPATHQDWDTNL